MNSGQKYRELVALLRKQGLMLCDDPWAFPVQELLLRHQSSQPSDGALTNEGAEPVADFKALLAELGDALEELEIWGRHSDQGYRKLKDWYRKSALACLAVEPIIPYPPAPASVEPKICTCPSGDGSLRWPCPVHPPEVKAVVLPDRLQGFPAEHARRSFYEGWNACLDRVKELNS